MTIVVRADKKSSICTGGQQAKLVSRAVIKAYERAQSFDPVSLYQWETNAWTKICLKVHSDQEIRQIAAKAESVGLNHFLLEKEVTLTRPKPKPQSVVEEEKKEASLEALSGLRGVAERLCTENGQWSGDKEEDAVRCEEIRTHWTVLPWRRRTFPADPGGTPA